MSLLTWVGSKKRLLPYLDRVIEQYLKGMTSSKPIYVEPFLGSGSVLIYILEKYPTRFKRYVCCDANEVLIEVFKQVKTNPTNLIRVLEQLQDLYYSLDMDERKDFFYKARKQFNDLRLNRSNNKLVLASLFVFLNKTCFRGVFRVNQNGELVAAFGYIKGQPKIVNHDLIMRLHRLFNDNDVQFHCCSYDELDLGD